MNIQMKEIPNNTNFRKCACCDADINLYSSTLTFSVCLNLDIFATDESEVKETAKQLIESFDLEAAIDTDLSQNLILKSVSIN